MTENYEEMLKKGKSELPEKTESKERLERVEPILEKHGKTTLVKNFNEIVKNIRREPAELMKYLFKQLGAKGSFSSNGLVINANITRDILVT